MLSTPHLALKSFNDDLSSALDTIYLPIKIGNDEDGCIHTEETFLAIEAKSRYNVVANNEWQHKIGVIVSTFY